MISRMVCTIASICVTTLGSTVPVIAAAQHTVASGNLPDTIDPRTAQLLLSRPVTASFHDAPLKQVIDSIAAHAGVKVFYDTQMLMSVPTRVTLQLTNTPLGIALERALEGTTLGAVPIAAAKFVIVERQHANTVAQDIQGVVTDAKTKQPLRGAMLSLDDDAKGVTTDGDGRFRLSNVPAGPHRVVVRLIGYTKRITSVTVADGEPLTVSFALDSRATALDNVVVTGTVIPTALKAVPSAITVITGKQLEERGITHIDQLFHGDVPGVFASNLGSGGQQPGQVVMASRGSTSLNLALSQPMKTYVDGVELSDPTYLGLIDPRSIDRIEILTGPQASTIYGSGAINGVMQVFTKRGTTSRPQLTATLLSGFIQNSFSSSLAPQHDYAAQVAGVDGHISYNLGGSWLYIGPWTPAIRQSVASGFGGARREQGPVTLDVSVRRVLGTDWSTGDASQWLSTRLVNGVYSESPGSFGGREYVTTSQTFGMTMSYSPFSWWSHTATVGNDASDALNHATGGVFYRPSDSTLYINDQRETRTSLAYTTVVRFPMTSMANAIVSAGADGWRTLTTLINADAPAYTGVINDGRFYEARNPAHNRGMFLQSQLSVLDAVTFTYGLRAEWNPNYGPDANPNIVPRYGVAYTQELGPVTAKVRGSYGHATRPPNAQDRRSFPGDSWALPYYGPIAFSQRANPGLVPEEQRGGEGGLEVYLGNRASLTVTRYNQTVNNLIQRVKVDSIELLPAYLDIFGCRPWQCAYLVMQSLNIGAIRNQGWELQGTLAAGPLSAKGTYSWTKSRLIGVAPAYRLQFPQYVVGAPFSFLPEHTYSAQLQYANAGTNVVLNVHGQGSTPYTGSNSLVYATLFSRTAATDAPRTSLPGNLVFYGTTYSTADLNASRRMSNHVEAIVQVQNLANRFAIDPYYGLLYAAMGRQTKLGARVHW